jgi:hypothetical protein
VTCPGACSRGRSSTRIPTMRNPSGRRTALASLSSFDRRVILAFSTGLPCAGRPPRSRSFRRGESSAPRTGHPTAFPLYFGARTEGGSGLWVVNLEAEPKPRKLLSGTSDPAYAQFSPDGRWTRTAPRSPAARRCTSLFSGDGRGESGIGVRRVAAPLEAGWPRDLFHVADNEMIATPSG